MMWRAAILALAALIAASNGLGAKSKLIGKFESWDAATDGAGKARTCYISSLPKKSTGKYKKRGEASITIAHWPTRKRFNEVTVVGGYRYRKKSEVTVVIGGTAFRLFTHGERAWAYAGDDAKLVRAMKSGASMTVTGISTKKTRTVDTYSLKGISKALAAIGKACSGKFSKRKPGKKR